MTNLPYFNHHHHRKLTQFLFKKFQTKLKQQQSNHYLLKNNPVYNLKFIKEQSLKYKYFLRLDIKKFYPSINHQKLLKQLPINYELLNNKPISRQFKKYINQDLPDFLQLSPYKQGLPIGQKLSWLLAGLFLLHLDLDIKNPYLQYVDDYLIFCKNKREVEIILKNKILPILQNLNLELNLDKLKSGRLHQEPLIFLGFKYYGGHFTIADEKIEKFKYKIHKLTYLTNRKEAKSLIKLVNNQILGFGHYYKLTKSRQVMSELDCFIRNRLRRHIARKKNNRKRQLNFLLTNEELQKMNLKSLLDIYDKYALKKKGIKTKISKKSKNNGDKEVTKKHQPLTENTDRIYRYAL